MVYGLRSYLTSFLEDDPERDLDKMLDWGAVADLRTGYDEEGFPEFREDEKGIYYVKQDYDFGEVYVPLAKISEGEVEVMEDFRR